MQGEDPQAVRMSARGRVHIRTLGCPKNEADGAALARHLERNGWTIVDHPEAADAEIVNTCGFIEATKLESLEAVWEAVARKEGASEIGRVRRLIVTGCLAQRYPKEIVNNIPGLDAVIGFDRPDLVSRALSQPAVAGTPACWVEKPHATYREHSAPWVFADGHPAPLSVYVKIGDGCDNACRFCAIPQIRGKLRSRSLPSICDEVVALVSHGTKEVILVSQDTTSWGLDQGDGLELGRLLEAINAVEGSFWIRVMYAHPAFLTVRQIAALAACQKVVPYLDLPMQHASDRMLRIMNRHTTRAETQAKIDALRRALPDLALRTTFIVGHPGETERDFAELLAFAGDNAFERMGVFAYSAEEGTPAARLRGTVRAGVARDRRERLTAEFDRWSALQSADKVGRTLACLIEQPGDSGGWVGRTPYDAPEIDGQVVIAGDGISAPGLYDVTISSAQGIDLVGSIGPNRRVGHQRGGRIEVRR